MVAKFRPAEAFEMLRRWPGGRAAPRVQHVARRPRVRRALQRCCDMHPFEEELWGTKKRLGVNADCDIPVAELKRICE
eukprot:gene8155-8080_t